MLRIMKNNKYNQFGFTAIEALLIILVLAVIGFGGYYVWHTQHDNKKTTSTTTSAGNKTATSAKTTSVSKTSSPYAGWQSHTLPVEKLSLMYPSGWSLSSSGSESSDSATITAQDGSVFNFEDGISNGGDGIPEAPASNDIPITFIGNQDYLGLMYGRGDRGSGSSDGLISGVMLQTSTNINGGPNGGFAYPTDKYAEGSTADFGTGVEVNFMTAFLNLGTQITLQQVPGSTDIKTAELIIQSMHY
jgi:Tfp pilus assembly major pilin PilA